MAVRKTVAKRAVKKTVAKTAAKKTVRTAAKKTDKEETKTSSKKTGTASRGLGKGLDALLSSDGIPEDTSGSVVELKINDISPNTDQPRKVFDANDLTSLSRSIERRWRAARIAGLKVIPAIVRELTSQQIMEQALIENLQREDLNPLEEAYAMENLLKTPGMNQEKLAKKLGKPRATIANTVRLINIDESLKDFIINGDLSAGHAKAILSLKNPDDQRKVANVILAKDMTVRQAEEYVKKYAYELEHPEAAQKAPKKVLSEQFELSTREVETTLKKSLGSKVKLKVLDSEAGRGKIVIDYKSYDDLQRLIDMLK